MKTTAIISSLILAMTAHAQSNWNFYKENLLKDSALLRFYTFENLNANTREIPSLGSEKESLKSAVPLEIVPGRFPGKTAVRLDKDNLTAKRFELADKTFTAQMWVRINGIGVHRGNAGSTNGTLMSIGIGYWDGWRVTASLPDGSTHFEMGRPRGINAFTMGTNQPLMLGNWQHIAVSWDGKVLRHYLNGRLKDQRDYSEAYTEPEPNAAFTLGFAGYGIGSVNCDVDEVVIHKRALPPAEIAASAIGGDPLSQDTFATLDAIQQAGLDNSPQAATELSRKLLASAQTSPALKLWLHCQDFSDSSLEDLLESPLYQSPQIPDHLKAMVHFRVLRNLRSNLQISVPRSLLETLQSSSQHLPAEDMRCLQLKLSMLDFQDGKREEVLERFHKLLAENSLEVSQKGGLTLAFAHFLRSIHSYPEARDLYHALSDSTEQSRQVRGIAALAAAQTFLLEKKYPEAVAEFQKVSSMELQPHHRQEAKECAEEAQRLAQGKPARDPEANRQRLEVLSVPRLAVHVSPSGDDEAAGTAEAPFLSLETAVAKVRALRKANPGQATAIVLHGGEYRISKTLELTGLDSGAQNAPFIIMAAPGERPVLSGGVRLRAFISETDPAVLARLPKGKRINLLVCDLNNIPLDFNTLHRPKTELYEDGVPLPPARWPNSGFLKTANVNEKQQTQFTFQEPEPAVWTKAQDIWTYGYWKYLWAADYLKVKAIHQDSHTIELMSTSQYGLASNMPYYFFNLLEAIDQPGEWFLDRQARKLYLFPDKPLGRAKLELSILDMPFITIKDASHIAIHGLTFDLSQGNGLEMAHVRDVRISGCTLTRLVGDGILASDARNLAIYGNDFNWLGRGGMRLSGGDRKTLTPGNIVIENNRVQNFSRIDRTYTPAVNLDGVGNRIAHNIFCHAPHHAIRLEGNDHIVEYNEVYDVVRESDDQSGIDMWYNPSYQGNIIRYNFWHHIGSGRNVAGQSGIRLDDAICNVLMYSNIFLHAADGQFGAIQIHGGKDNIADNNLYIACQAAASFSLWSDQRWAEMFKRQNMITRLHKDIEINEPPYSTKYPWLANLEKTNGENYFWRSLIVRCNTVAMRRHPSRHEFLETLATDAKDAFPAGDTAESMASGLSEEAWHPFIEKTAIRPIPFKEIGLYSDPNCAATRTR